MKIHYLQHVPFEDLANIDSWARSRGHDLSRTLLFSGEELSAHPELLSQIQGLMEQLMDRMESVLGPEQDTS